VEEARQLWDRLIRKPWANPDADFDVVMEALAPGHWVDELLVSREWAARSPYRPPLSPIPPGEAGVGAIVASEKRGEEMVVLARIPCGFLPMRDSPYSPAAGAGVEGPHERYT
jgi:hypothetical protein